MTAEKARMLRELIGIAAIGLVALTSLPSAQAALGMPASSVGTDGKALKLEKGENKSFGSYTVEEWTSKDLKIREYISNKDTVIGLAWWGNGLAALPGLLGNYAGDYEKYENEHPRRSGRIPYRKIKAGNLIVETWDLLRKHEGRAYAPSIVPSGVSAEDFNMKKWSR